MFTNVRALSILFFFWLSPLHVRAADSCQVRLIGAEHFGSFQQTIAGSLPRYVRGSADTLVARFFGVFHPDELSRALRTDGGLSAAAVAQINHYLEMAHARSRPDYLQTIDASFHLLTANHDPSAALINLCVFGRGCSGFSVNEAARPYLNISVIGPLIPARVSSVDAGQIPAPAPDFYFNAVFLRAEDSPEDFAVNLFSGLAVAQMTYILRQWVGTRTDLQATISPIFGRFVRVTAHGVVVDHGFMLFMQQMHAFRAEMEFMVAMGNSIPESVFNRPGRLNSPQAAIARVARYPDGQNFLEENGIAATNALQLYLHYMNELLGPSR